MPVVCTYQGGSDRVSLCEGHVHLVGEFVLLPARVDRGEHYGACAACDWNMPLDLDTNEQSADNE